MAQFDIAQGLINQAFSSSMQSAPPDPMKLPGVTLAPQNNPDVTSPEPQPAQQGGEPNFAKDFFGVEDPSQILQPKGRVPGDPSKVFYKFAGDGKYYSAKADAPLQTVLERIWDKKAPSLWQSAKGEAMYGLPSSMASAVAYGLDGMGADKMSDQWRQYSDKLRQDFEQKYGQHMVPSFDAALEHGKLWDFMLENVGMSAPYMVLAAAGAGAGGLAGGAAATGSLAGGMESMATGTAAARLGSFIGSTAITSPVTIAQFADRQVAQLKEAGVEDPERHIDWAKAAAYGTAAAGLQSLPMESILLGKGVLGGLSKWGLKPGSGASRRILGAIADVAGTNALAMGGTSFLSRANADMPLLDDDAKHEYLTSAITGSLVGIPFGIYKGVRGRHEPATVPPDVPNGTTEEVINRNTDKPDPSGGTTVKPDSNVIYAGPPPEEKLLPPPKHAIFYDENHSYGIQDIHEARDYMDSIHYTGPDGKPTTGLEDFLKVHGANYTDSELVIAARRAKKARDLNYHVLKTKDGILYRTMDDLPQTHSNAPDIISKAAELTDKWGLPDSQVRQWSDSMINKMHEVYFKRDLAKAAQAVGVKDPETLGKALKEAQSALNEKAIQDVQQYGSLYKRPEALAREAAALEGRIRNISRNPRKDLAEALLRIRKTQAQAKANAAAEGTQGEYPIRQPFYGDPGMDLATSPEKAADIMAKHVGSAQRGAPEESMRAAQEVMGGGVFPSLLEQIGDLSHRITHHLGMGQVYGHEKVLTGLSRLKDTGDLLKGIASSLKNNFEYRKEKGLLPEGVTTFEQYKKLTDAASKRYADEHAKLPVFNEAQYHAREAAVNLGKKKLGQAKLHLEALDKIFKSKNAMEQFKDYRVNKDGKMVTYTPDNPLFDQPRLKVTPKSGRPDFIDNPPVDGEAFGPYAGMKPDALGPRALLTYQPFGVNSTKDMIRAIDQGSNIPGPRVNDRVAKKDLVRAALRSPIYKEWFKNDPDIQKIIADKKVLSEAAFLKKYGKDPIEKTILGKMKAAEARSKKEERAETRAEQPGAKPRKEDTTGQFRYEKPPKTAKKAKVEVKDLDEDAAEHLKTIREDLERRSQERNSEKLKNDPAMRAALNDIFKNFAELRGKVEMPESGFSQAMKGHDNLLSSIARRTKVLDIVEGAFKHFNAKGGEYIRGLLDKAIGGQALSEKERAHVATLIHTVFALGKDGIEEGKSLNPSGITDLYLALRNASGSKVKQKLLEAQKFLAQWHKDAKGINPADLDGFSPGDVEANAFLDYLSGELKINTKGFNKLKISKFFDAHEKAFKRIRKELGDMGLMEASDIFQYNKGTNERVAPEARRESVFTERVSNAAGNKEGEKVAQAQADSMQKAAADKGGSTPPPKFTEPPKEAAGGPDPGPLAKDFNSEIGGPLYSFWNYVSSIPAKARAIKEWAITHQIFLDTQIDTAANEMQMMNKMKELKNTFKWDTIRDAHDILAHLRETDQRIEYDPLRRIVFNKDGVQVQMTPEMSRAIEGVTDYYKEAMRMGVRTFRGHLDEFGEEKLNHASSMENIKRVLDDFKNKIDDNPFAEQKRYYTDRRDAIQQIYNKIREFEENIVDDAPYVPFMRFGDYMVMVKDRKTGKLVHFQPLNRYNKLGSRARLPSEKEARQKIEALGLYKKYNAKDYEIAHFKANYNEIAKYINHNHLSTELIQGLVASGLTSNLKLADHLATGIESTDSFLSDLRDTIKNDRTRALKYVTARGVGRFSIKSENIPGYDKDWSMVMDSYRGIWASSLAKQGHAMKSMKAQADLMRAPVPNHLIKDIQNYMDYVNSPDSDMATLRTASFFWTMGFNPSSALLQLATLPNQAMAHMLENSPHLLYNMGIMGSNFKKAVAYIRGKRGVFTPDEEHLFENEAYHFRASIRHEADESYAIQNSVNATKFDRAADWLLGASGKMIGATERLTRIATYSSLKELYTKHPEALEQFMQNRKDDHNWQEFWNNQKPKHNAETAAALYGMTLTHGVFGKSGRGEMQKGLMGSLFLPFSTYAQQMLEVLGDQLSGKQGINGRMAGLYGIGAFVLMAGVAGIPAYELYKTLYEQYQKNVNGHAVDLEMQLKEAGLPRWLQYGLLSSSFGVDVSKRLGENVIGEHLLVGALKGEFKAADLGGVPGRVMGNTLKEASKLLSGDGHTDVMDVLSTLMPGGLQNVTKAAKLATDPAQAVQTSSGQLAMDPNKVDMGDIAAQAMGFTPLGLSEGRKAIYWDSLARQEWNQWRSRLAEGTANAQFMIHTGNRNGDIEMVREGQELKRQLHKQMVENARNNKIPLDGSFWSSFNNAVKDRLWKKMNPGKIRKPSKGEQQHLDVLTTDKNGNY